MKYQDTGLAFDIDFGTGKWDASIEGNQFEADMAPKKGGMRVKLLIGESLISGQTFVLQRFTTDLKYSG